MYQGTTPALNCVVFNWDLTDKTVYLTIECGMTKITKYGHELVITYVDDQPDTEPYSSVICLLTQSDTLSMRGKEATIQMRFVDSNGMAYASTKAKIDINDVIYRAVIEYEGSEEP